MEDRGEQVASYRYAKQWSNHRRGMGARRAKVALPREMRCREDCDGGAVCVKFELFADRPRIDGHYAVLSRSKSERQSRARKQDNVTPCERAVATHSRASRACRCRGEKPYRVVGRERRGKRAPRRQHLCSV